MRTLLFLGALASGCMTDVDESEVVTMEDEGDEVETSERVALNGLTAMDATVAPATPSFPLLAAVAQGTLPTAGTRVPSLFATEHGREQFAYLVSCAIPSTKTISIKAGGVTYSFKGAMNLASGWINQPLAVQSYKVVSACMLARTNFYGVAVPISMRGPGLATPSWEVAAFTVLEGAFWGDVFTATGTVNACTSPAKLAGSTVSTLPLRECTVSVDGITTKCGFKYAGDCSKICTMLNGSYTKCAGVAETIAVLVAKP